MRNSAEGISQRGDLDIDRVFDLRYRFGPWGHSVLPRFARDRACFSLRYWSMREGLRRSPRIWRAEHPVAGILDMCAHRGSRGFAIAGHDGLENIFVLLVDSLQARVIVLA